MICAADTASIEAQLAEARAQAAGMTAQLAAEASARATAIQEAKDAAARAHLLESQVDALNRAAADATKRLQESLNQMEASRAVRPFLRLFFASHCVIVCVLHV